MKKSALTETLETHMPENGTELFITGKTIDVDSNSWELVGVFKSEYEAESACIDFNYFFVPITLEGGVFYPHAVKHGA